MLSLELMMRLVLHLCQVCTTCSACNGPDSGCAGVEADALKLWLKPVTRLGLLHFAAEAGTLLLLFDMLVGC